MKKRRGRPPALNRVPEKPAKNIRKALRYLRADGSFEFEGVTKLKRGNIELGFNYTEFYPNTPAGQLFIQLVRAGSKGVSDSELERITRLNKTKEMEKEIRKKMSDLVGKVNKKLQVKGLYCVVCRKKNGRYALEFGEGLFEKSESEFDDNM